MRILVDTNVLLRIAQPASPQCVEAIQALDALYVAQSELCVVPQVIYEYWVSATRPIAANGLGLTSSQVQTSVDVLLQSYLLLADDAGVYSRWYDVVTKHQVEGKQAHDARIVAAMLGHNVKDLLTFNQGHFTRFNSIQVLTPAEILVGKLPV